MGFNGSGAATGAASGAATGAAFGPWGALAGGVIGGVAGGFSGGGGADSRLLATMAGNAQAGNTMVGAYQNQQFLNPYYNSGLGSLAQLDYMNTGLTPEWTDDNQARLDELLGQREDLESRAQDLLGKLSVAGTSRGSRHYAEVFGPEFQKVQAQLQELNKLEQQQKSYQMFQNPEVRAMLGNDGSQYIDQLANLDITPDLEEIQNDPIYQWQQRQMQDAINMQQASLGSLNSRDTFNITNDGAMSLASREADKIYGRKVGSIMDQYNITNQLFNQQYGRLNDSVNRGLGVATNFGGAAQNAANQVGSAYANMNLNKAQYQQPNMANQLISSLGQGISNYQDYDMMENFIKPYFSNMNSGTTIKPITSSNYSLGNYGVAIG